MKHRCTTISLALIALLSFSFRAYADDSATSNVSYEIHNTTTIKKATDIGQGDWDDVTMPIAHGVEPDSDEAEGEIEDNNLQNAELLVSSVDGTAGEDPAGDVRLYVQLTTDPDVGKPKNGWDSETSYQIWNRGSPGNQVGEVAYDLDDSGTGSFGVTYQLRDTDNANPHKSTIEVTWTIRDAN